MRFRRLLSKAVDVDRRRRRALAPDLVHEYAALLPSPSTTAASVPVAEEVESSAAAAALPEVPSEAQQQLHSRRYAFLPVLTLA